MKIALFGQFYQNSTAPIIERVLAYLKSQNIIVVVEINFLENLKANNVTVLGYNSFAKNTDLNDTFDMLISVGGDGTFLKAATLVRKSGIPILGINAGRLGFLATVQQKNIEKFLQLAIEKKYLVSKRTLLSLKGIPKIDAFGDLNFALNEVTVSRKDTTSMITIDTYLNDEYLTSYWADGLIISTPTGSTGYSMSCGGPIMAPQTNALIITPIAPHNLNARPLVVPDDTEIKLKISGREENYLVSLDSRIASVKNEAVLTIKKSSNKINVIEFAEETFFKTLRNKLLWGEDKRN